MNSTPLIKMRCLMPTARCSQSFEGSPRSTFDQDPNAPNKKRKTPGTTPQPVEQGSNEGNTQRTRFVTELYIRPQGHRGQAKDECGDTE